MINAAVLTVISNVVVTSMSSSISLFAVSSSVPGEGIPPVIALLIAREKTSSYSVSVRDDMGSAWNKVGISTGKVIHMFSYYQVNYIESGFR